MGKLVNNKHFLTYTKNVIGYNFNLITCYIGI